MKKDTIRVDVCSRYNPDRKTYILAKTHINEQGRTFAVISRRQLQAAESRVCYGGTDGLRFLPTAGFSDFEETYSRAWHAVKYPDGYLARMRA